MFELIGSIFSFAFGLVKAGLSLAWTVVNAVISLLGGLFSLILTTGSLILAGGLILLAIVRRREYKAHHRQSDTEDEADTTRTYDVDQEEFTSFYDQYRAQE